MIRSFFRLAVTAAFVVPSLAACDGEEGTPGREPVEESSDAAQGGADADPGPDGATAPQPDAGTGDAAAGDARGDEPDGGGDAAPAPFTCDGAGARFATSSPSHAFGPGQDIGQALFPAPVLGPPKGGGDCQGSLDVVSLGNGGSVVLAFDGNAIIDGPGPDFIVFENAFGVGCDTSNPFAELGTVSVSDDGVTWVDYPCTAVAAPYGACSGWHPVYANADTNAIDPLDPAVAGGDAYDLADVGLARARFVRVVDRVDLTGTAGVYDLDAVGIVHPACP